MLFVFASLLFILSCVTLLVFPAVSIIKEQYQDASSAGRRFLSHQIAILSAGSETSETNTPARLLEDEDLEIELLTDGLESPTSMTFIGRNGDMLILEKSGKVMYFIDDNKTKKSLLNFSTVDDRNERGLLGVAVIDDMPDISTNVTTATSNNYEAVSTTDNSADNNDALTAATTTTTTATKTPSPPSITYVFFYLTEANEEDKTQPLGNRIYRFEWDDANKSLSNGKLLLDLPVLPGQNHNGGKLIADSENSHLYAVIGDLNRKGMLQNFKNGSLPDDTSAIIRINPDGSPARGNPFLNVSTTDDRYANLSKYYAYGIRNSFGLAIDPLTGTLWDTENGPDEFDEINIVRPGFNSGWAMVMGPIGMSNLTAENDLVNFQDSPSYEDPVFSWGRAVGITDIEFYESDVLGNDYTNNIFVADANHGDLYFFEINEDRTSLQFENPEIDNDLVASNENERISVTFGTSFPSSITDIETGPDGYLYILTYHPTMGSLFRIIPQE
jgi:glucose/arabinose dehydrogenase